MESELLKMEFNVLHIIAITVIMLILFSVSYCGLLLFRYNRRRHLILDKHYMDQLFVKSSSSIAASQDANGDISIKTVHFKQEDFQFIKEIDNLKRCFALLADQEGENHDN